MKRLNLLLLTTAFALLACGKKQEPSAPDLSVPKKVLAGDQAPGASRDVPAEAEVKASSGPIELTLRLYKMKIKAGESLWHQLQVRNISDQEVTVTDQVFHDPWELRNNIRGRYGIYIEVQGPDGQPLELKPPSRGGNDIMRQESGLLKIEGAEEKAMVEGWKRQGLSDSEIAYKTVQYNLKKERDKEAKRRLPVIRLKPGERAETKSWFHYSELERIRNKPVPQAIGEFTELEFFEFNKQGKYRIRAVHDLEPTPELNRMRGDLPIYPEEVLVRTPWIEVTVLP